MAKNIYNNNKPTAQVSLNGFDAGQFQVYSMKAGIGNPVFYMPTNPKFKCRINVQNFMMAENLRQNAFLRAKQNIDFFFIPFRQINHQFSALYYGRHDEQTVLSDPTRFDECVPIFNLRYVIQELSYDFYFAKFYSACFKALYSSFMSTNATENNYLTSISFVKFVSDVVSAASAQQRYGQLNGNVYNRDSLVFKTYTCQHFTPVQISDYKSGSQDDIYTKFYKDFDYTVEDNLRILDMLGYGNFIPDLNRNFYNDVFTSLHYNFDSYINDNLLATTPSTINDCVDIWYQFVGDFTTVTWTRNIVPPRTVNAFNLCAYQKIFDNVYRNSILAEPFKYGIELVKTFNTDGIYDELVVHYGSAKFCALFLTPYFIQHRRNITNGLWNSPAFGGNINVPLNSSDPSYTDQSSLSHNGVSIPDLRLGFAMQQFRERLLRCGNREKDLLRGLFGTKSRYISDEYVYYIGSFDGTFNVNTVQDVSGENLGRLGGNIMSSVTGNQLEFSTEEFGVILAIHTVLPTMVYNAFGVDVLNRKSEQFDFFHPDFENLGLQPVYLSQFNNLLSAQDDRVVGYSARWIEYKQKLDLSHGLFCDSSNPEELAHDESSLHVIERGSDSDYVTNFDNATIGTLSAQYVSPYSLDNIFDTLTDYSLYSDHFKCWLNVKCDVLQPMSVLGLPQLS